MTWFTAPLALAMVTCASGALAADHLDSPSVKLDAAADITDVYSWMDGSNVVLMLNVNPIATGASKFSDKVQYVFHTESHAAFGGPGTKTDVICTFDAAQAIQCWIGTADYVKGDASAVAGLKSASGDFKVFAGLRDDPFFFNLAGFNDVVETVVAVAPTLDPAGCPDVDAGTSTLLVNKLKDDPMNPNPLTPAPKDFFAGLNVLSIVLSVDKKLLNGGGPVMSVWASTNKAGG